MSQPYTSEEKERAMELYELSGSVGYASRQTGIPERTIRHWRQQRERDIPLMRDPERNPVATLPEKNVEPLPANSPREELQTLRDQIMFHVQRIVASLSDDDVQINERAIAVTRLLDRVMRLDAQLAQAFPGETQRIIFQYQYQDPDGSLHDKPIWERDDDEDDQHLPAFPAEESTGGSELW